ncbi:MAG: hypothetical protein ACOYLH_06380 [Flavobacteriales bacterium]|jgi:hypothetical protein
MENQTIDAGFSNTSSITTQIQENLRIAGKWGRFLAILGFIGLGFMILGSISMFAFISNSRISGSNGMTMSGIGFLYLAIGILYFFPTLFLLRLSNAALNTGLYGNETDLEEMTLNLKKLFKFIGILTIITIGIYILVIIFSLIALVA